MASYTRTSPEKFVSDFKRRVEGVRIKHRVNGNSVKLYDKAYTPKGSVLRRGHHP
jgi:hypothetical protein